MIFKIKKGHHYSDGFLYKIFNFFHKSDRIRKIVNFNENSKYIDETLDKFDVNKLFGFSNGYHHKNSYRFGWNCLDGKIHIYAYSYINSIRQIDEICSINTNQEYKFIIKVNKNKVIFSVINDKFILTQIVQTMEKLPKNNIIKYTLWPYFGGNKIAPKNILIELI